MIKHLGDTVYIHTEQGYYPGRWWHHVNMDKRHDSLSTASSPVMISIPLRPTTLMPSLLMCHPCFTSELCTPLILHIPQTYEDLIYFHPLHYFCLSFTFYTSRVTLLSSISNHMVHLLVLMKFLPITVNSFFRPLHIHHCPLGPFVSTFSVLFWDSAPVEWERQELSSLENQVG